MLWKQNKEKKYTYFNIRIYSVSNIIKIIIDDNNYNYDSCIKI